MLSKAAAALITPAIIGRVVERVDPKHPPRGFKEGKFVIFVGGGKASGKSTIKQHLFNILTEEGYKRDYVAEFGSDIFKDILDHPALMEFRNRFDGYAKGVAGVKRGFLYEMANHVFERARKVAFAQGSPLVFDYHMDDQDLMVRLTEEAKAHGYECIFISPHISADKVLERLEKRKADSGRPYNMQRALETHRDFAQHLPNYFRAFDVGIILDNNTEHSTPQPIVLSRKGELTVFDGVAYEDIKRKAGLNVEATTAAELYTQQPGADPALHANPAGVGESADAGKAGGQVSFAEKLINSLVKEEGRQRGA